MVLSPVQLQLENQAKVSPIGRVPHLLVEVKGLQKYVDFDVIEIVDESNSYPALLGIGWENDNLAVINFKKRVMTFENRDMQIISPLYPKEGQRYVEPIKEEVVGGWDNAYNIFEDYINPTVNGEMGWRSTSSASFNHDDALENWHNSFHQVSVRKCG